jgi:hypothetical protein
MKKVRSLIFVAIVLFLTSCVTTTNFPVSSVTPAAVITVKMKKDKNKNTVIEVTAKNMASADRLSPPKNNYVVWLETDNNGTKNIGQLTIKNSKTSSLKTSTPFGVKGMFITAEDQGDVSYPSGIEISRTGLSSR